MIILRNKQFNLTPALKRVRLKGQNSTRNYIEGVFKTGGSKFTKRNVGAYEAGKALDKGVLNTPKNSTIGKAERLIKKGTESFAQKRPTIYSRL